MSAAPVTRNPRLFVSLITALLQGLLLFWLHAAVQSETWPATQPVWLAGLYSIGLFLPVTIHLLSEHWRTGMLWGMVTTLGAVFFYFGWHFGAYVAAPPAGRPLGDDSAAVYMLTLTPLWLMIMPFLRCRLAAGRWRCGYEHLFASAWQNKIMLAEAALFTGVLWLLLGLWMMLFKMLGYTAFERLFTWPAFVYPFTAVAFGLALYLTQSVDRIVTAIREQLLGLLKWLAPVAALILAIFAPTLLVKLPALVFSGERAIGAAWLLWLLAVTVLLLNAGYQNGRIERPYPALLALLLRIIIPAMPFIALVALYAMYVRISEYGVTVERVFAMIIALTALAYSAGYTVAAIRRGPWLRGIEGVNVGVAIALIAVLGLTLTPVASPFRLAASSQYARVIDGRGDREDALRYLRFDAGDYGRRALERLAELRGSDALLAISGEARRFLEMTERWEAFRVSEARDVLADIAVYPAGRAIEPALEEAIRQSVGTPLLPLPARPRPVAQGGPRAPIVVGAAGTVMQAAGPDEVFGLFTDLNGDSVDEFVILAGVNLTLFSRREEGWTAVGSRPAPELRVRGEALRQLLEAGDFAPQPAQWSDLRIGDNVLQMTPSFRPNPSQ